MLSSIVDRIVVTAELMGSQITPVAAAAMAHELSGYPSELVSDALSRCCREVTGRLTLAAVLSRIRDGHPAPNEAWATCIRAADESASVCWTPEMARALEAARPLLEVGDKVAARMAFIDAYTVELQQARAAGRGAAFALSLGHDPDGRRRCAAEAVERGLLARESVDPALLEAPPPRDAMQHLLPGRSRAVTEPSPAAIAGMAAIAGLLKGCSHAD